MGSGAGGGGRGGSKITILSVIHQFNSPTKKKAPFFSSTFCLGSNSFEHSTN